MNDSATVGALLATAPRDLRLDAELLVGAALNWPRSRVLAYPEQPLDPAAHEHLQAVLARRETGEPLAYLLGVREFYGLELTVNAAVLIPRPETELLVERLLADAPAAARVLDLGTGSGAIAIAAAHQRRDLDLVASDVSTAALAVAEGNARRHGVALELVHSNWFSAISGCFDCLVSNPPYLAASDPHLAALRYEPRNALVAGDDGLAAYRCIAAGASQHLKPGGRLLLEIGATQAADVHRLLAGAGFEGLRTFDDLAGLPRVVQADWHGNAP